MLNIQRGQLEEDQETVPERQTPREREVNDKSPQDGVGRRGTAHSRVSVEL